MCGRFVNQFENKEAWESFFGEGIPDDVLEEVRIGYNICPTQIIPIFCKDAIGSGVSGDSGNGSGDGDSQFSWHASRWSIVAPWANEVSTKYATFNARSETVSEKASFKNAFNKGQRCVIPALGYYEWKSVNDEKQPYFAQRGLGEPIFFGGLYEPARDDIPHSCTILTLPATNAMKPLHHRMPLMVKEPAAWLEHGAIENHLVRAPWHKVAKTVSNPRNQGATLIEKV